MNIAIVYFCYKRDYDILNISLRNMHLLKEKNNITVYLADDENNPIPYIPQKCKYFKTSFKRNGNMNGLECFIGTLDVYNRILLDDNYDWVIKVDPDTIINSLDFIYNIDMNKYFQFGTEILSRKHKRTGLCYGCFHGITKKGLFTINKNITENFIASTTKLENKGIRIPEDKYKSILSGSKDMIYFLKNEFNNPIVNSSDNGVYFDFKYRKFKRTILNLPFKCLKQYCAITFKNIIDFRKTNLISNHDNMNHILRMEKYSQWYIENSDYFNHD